MRTIALSVLWVFCLVFSGGAWADGPYGLAFSTYFGGNGDEGIRDVELDAEGNVYVAGTTGSPDFPTTPGAFDETFDASEGEGRWGYNKDIFVAKFTPGGKLVWSTVIGGPNTEEVYGLEIDSTGHVIVHGRGAVGSPVTPGVYQEEFKGCGGGDPGNPHNTAQNAYICKLTPDGSSLVWGSFFGIDHLHRDLALDANDDIYTTWGVRPNAVNPAHWDNWMDPAWNANAFQPEPQGEADCGVAKIKSDGSKVIWATYLGGSKHDSIEGFIDLDAEGYVYVGCWTRSRDLPTTESSFDRTYNGGADLYLAKLTPDGSDLVYGCYIGDEGDNFPETHNLAVDAEGNCYASVTATSNSFPNTGNGIQRKLAGGTDRGVVKLSPTGALLGATFLGGRGDDHPEGVAVGPGGVVAFFGQSRSADFPVSDNAYQRTKNAESDALVIVLSPDLDKLVYGTFLGGEGMDGGRSGSMGADGSLVVAGGHMGGGWPTKNAHQTSLSGPEDSIIARFSPTP